MSDQGATDGFAVVLRRLRTEARLTQEQLAERSTVSVRTIRDLERGRIRSPRPESLRLLAGVLGVSGPELTEFEELGRREYWRKRGSAEEPASAPDPGGGARTHATPVPSQLPPDVTAFTGRDEQLHTLDAMLQDDGSGIRVAVLVGTPGVGKTAVAVHWAHRVRRLFPDGQIHLNLAGYSTRAPLSAEEAVNRLLRALGVAPETVPPDVAEAAALLRSLLADTRTLLVFDDVRDADQVQSLLPGAPGCFVLVTSRTAQRVLVARHGARHVTLLPFTSDESHALLSRVLGSENVAAEPAAVVELAQLCGHLPLALRIAAANLVGRRGQQPVAAYLHRLRGSDRLAALSVAPGPETTVRTAFDLSYDALPDSARRLFRLLPLAPGREVTAAAAGALLGDTDRAPELLELLAVAHLVEETAPDRFVQPDLLQVYAVERASEEDEDERHAAWDRLLTLYLDELDGAARILYPDTLRLARNSCGRSSGFANHREALEWIDSELPALQDAVATAARTGPAQAAWLLADALRGYFQLRAAAAPWHAVAKVALTAAEAAQDLAAQAASHLSLAGACARQDRFDRAIDHSERALELAGAAGWTDGEIAAHRALGNLRRLAGRPREAITHLHQALKLAGPAHGPGHGAVLEQIATAHHELGELVNAAAHYEQALAVQRSSGSPAAMAQVGTGLGDALHGLGRLDGALHHLEEAFALHHELADRGRAAYNLRCQAEVHRDAGRPARALELAGEALDLARQDDDPRLQAQIRETLGTIHLAAGRNTEARTDLEAALTLAIETHNPYAQAQALIGLSRVRRRSGQHAQAVEHGAAAVDLARGGSYRLLEGHALTTLARAALAAGSTRAAVEHARAAVAAHHGSGSPAGLAEAEGVLHDAVTRMPEGA